MKPIIVVFALLLTLFNTNVYSRDIDQYTARKLREAGTIVPLESILNKAKKLHPGRIMEVELQQKRQFYIYEITIVDNQGKVWEMKYKANNGTLMSDERED